MDIEFRGDEVWLDGYLVATLKEDVPRSVAAKFKDFLDAPCAYCEESDRKE